ncbi:MAG: hypothetical protein EXQ56_09045 [Acidobacteria bacterium]|nr:hypothetical protein [Acidobacteriota bacterium]
MPISREPWPWKNISCCLPRRRVFEPPAIRASIMLSGGLRRGRTARPAWAMDPMAAGRKGLPPSARAAPLFYVSPVQINAQIPTDAGLGSVNVIVVRGNAQSNNAAITLVP